MSFKQSNFLIFISFFPVFALRSNLDVTEIFASILIFTLPILLINYFFFKKNVLSIFFLKIYLSIIIIFGIDNNIGLWNGVVMPFQVLLEKIFNVIYVPGLILFIILVFFTYHVILRINKKFYNIILIFITTLFIFNIFDQTKSYKKIANFKNQTDKKFEKTELVIIFDEMSGINSFESLSKEGFEFNSMAKEIFKKHNFEFYSDIKSIDMNTVSSISALLNYSTNVKKRDEVSISSPNYFTAYELKESLFLNDFDNISIYQTMYFNYCGLKNISKCESYSPFNRNKYLDGFKNSFLSKIISLWRINGSISSTMIWRTFREFRIIDSNLEPEGHKANFQHLLDKIDKDIDSKNYDLIFVHTLVPHKPYGFDKNCLYDGGMSTMNNSYSTNKHVAQHNLERKCVLKFLDKFLDKLIIDNKMDMINLTILSDHGSRILEKKNSSLSAIYAYKDKQTVYKEFKDETLIHKVFSERFN